MQLTKFDLMKRGGAWLGAARSWIQWNAINGDTVHWGSNDVVSLKTNLTVQVIEDIAAEVATAAINEDRERYINEHDIKFLEKLSTAENYLHFDDKFRLRMMVNKLKEK